MSCDIQKICGGINDTICEKKCEMVKMKEQYEILLKQYYDVYSEYLSFDNAKVNITYNRQQAERKRQDLNNLQTQLTNIQNSLKLRITNTNNSINQTENDIDILDSEMIKRYRDVDEKNQNMNDLKQEYNSRKRQIELNLEKHRYRRNIMWGFIIINCIAFVILVVFLYKNLKK